MPTVEPPLSDFSFIQLNPLMSSHPTLSLPRAKATASERAVSKDSASSGKAGGMDTSAPRGGKLGVEEVKAAQATAVAVGAGEEGVQGDQPPTAPESTGAVSAAGAGQSPSKGSPQGDGDEEEGDAVARRGDLELCKRKDVSRSS